MIASEKGFTLIELLLALTLTVIVLGVGFALYSYGVTSFTRAEEQVTKQQEVRWAHKILTEEIRYASEIEILSALPAVYQKDAVYVFVDKNGDLMRVAKGEESVLMPRSEYGPIRTIFMAEEGEKTLYLEVGIDSREWPYKVQALVSILNLAHGLGSDKGTILRYKAL